MVNKPSIEQLDKKVELLRKDLKELGKKIEQYKPSKEELDESLMQMIKRLEERSWIYNPWNNRIVIKSVVIMETKDIKLDSYILPERVKAKMILTLFKTHQAKKEKSITFCSKLDNNIIAKGYLTGSSDTVEIDPRVCSKNEKFLGGYHTRVDRDLYASVEDLGHCGTKITNEN